MTKSGATGMSDTFGTTIRNISIQPYSSLKFDWRSMIRLYSHDTHIFRIVGHLKQRVQLLSMRNGYILNRAICKRVLYIIYRGVINEPTFQNVRFTAWRLPALPYPCNGLSPVIRTALWPPYTTFHWCAGEIDGSSERNASS